MAVSNAIDIEADLPIYIGLAQVNSDKEEHTKNRQEQGAGDGLGMLPA